MSQFLKKAIQIIIFKNVTLVSFKALASRQVFFLLRGVKIVFPEQPLIRD